MFSEGGAGTQLVWLSPKRKWVPNGVFAGRKKKKTYKA